MIYEYFSENGAEENLNVTNKITSRHWRELHNEELRDLYSSPNVIRMMKSKNVRWRSM
jgi:glucan phosphorylase